MICNLKKKLICNKNKNNKMKTKLTLLLGIANFFLVISQNPNIIWQKTYGGSSYDTGQKILQTTDGGYLISATSESDDFDITQFYGLGDIVLLKIDASGSVVWQKAYGGSEYDYINNITATPDGGYVIVGGTESSDGIVTTPNQGSSDALIIKIDASGTVLWQKTFGGSESDSFRYTFFNTDGSYRVIGSTWSNDGDVPANAVAEDRNIWLLKIDATTGAIISNSIISPNISNEFIRSVVPTNNGGLLFCGNRYVESPQEALIPFIRKIDANDATVFYTDALCEDCDYGGFDDAVELEDGSFIVIGEHIDLTNGAKDYSSLTKFDASGTKVSEVILNDNLTAPYGNYSTNILKINSGFLLKGIQYDSNFNLDILLTQYNDQGIIEKWVIGGTSDESLDFASQGNIIQNTNGNYMILSSTASSDGDFTNNYGEDDIAVVEYKLESLKNPEQGINQVVKLYPNPVNNLLYIENNNGFPIEKVRILDPIGKIILQKTNSFETINVENLNSGLYLLQITTENNQIITQKFLKQ